MRLPGWSQATACSGRKGHLFESRTGAGGGGRGVLGEGWPGAPGSAPNL